MSSFICPHCQQIIDDGSDGFTSDREIELEKKLEIALSYLCTIKKLRNGKCFQCSDFAYRAIKKIKEIN